MRNPSVIVILIGTVLFLLGLALPFLEAVLARSRSRRVPVDRDPLPTHPSIDVVIAAYLESSVIGDTVCRLQRQLRGLPGRNRVVVIASDEDTARAAEKAGALVRRGEAHGKPAAINKGVGGSDADVIVLTDANCEIVPGNWPQLLLTHLQHADLVSAVKMEHGKREETYWKYEKAVKRFGGPQRETLSVIGEFLAFRRDQFSPLPVGVLADDLQLAEDFTLRGLSVQVCPGIETIEAPTAGADQLERRIRISAGHWAQAIPRWRELAQHPAGRQFLAHKGYRMSFGAFGFWLAALGVGLLAAPWTLIGVVLAVALAWVVYRHTKNAPWPLRLFATVVVLQAVTVLGLARAVRRGLAPAPQYGWKKVAR